MITLIILVGLVLLDDKIIAKSVLELCNSIFQGIIAFSLHYNVIFNYV